MMSPQQAGAEEAVANLVLWLKLAVEAGGALVIAAGALLLAMRYFTQRLAGGPPDYNRLRLGFARMLALALELQLAADILSTAVAPSWDQIGKLGAIAVLRTALNYFLAREIREAEAGRAAG
ncbi:DUF1622 domain-containing protein [Chromobacterium subtsugae]|uniref:DUF1622 domain-containing protein n=1 Tax=Chromobacterium subtsugae TaxID=251747 RepID=A0ABS7FAT3_9NEIS|nr:MULTISPECIES: DUF1622 domain-containing protein [Chromobacterium]MBW7565039.1 DUF1622 domain-containing protein [Chromobacterium subtsugae]MBW8286434.1 DUF1622 domain-containing protein [Chromobacterium subtsugae]WSE91523.1 DUF1622 domain-containing protein [Chromobacterium subtsugae]WVH59898.1 DUF1622 domain-containing protein [Chromobacterium subtsugae]